MELLGKVIDKISGNSSAHHDDISTMISSALNKVLGDMMEHVDDIDSAMVSSIDGVAWAQKLRDDFDQHRFAAMSSALLALSDNLIKEGKKGVIHNVMIEGDEGKIFVMHAGENLLLTVFTGSDSNLGMSLAFTKQAAEKIAALHITNT